MYVSRIYLFFLAICFLIQGCSVEENQICFDSCYWEVDKNYEEIEGEASAKSFLFNDSGTFRIIDYYDSKFDITSRFESNHFQLKKQLVKNHKIFYIFDYIVEFADKKIPVRSIAIKSADGTLVFWAPLAKHIEEFLASCNDSKEVDWSPVLKAFTY